MDAAGHSAFIVTAYAAAALIVLALIVWVRIDYRRQRRLIADLEMRGFARRSVRTEGPKP